MQLIRQVLLSNLIKYGFTKACGKPIKEATIEELQDEWHRYEVQHKKLWFAQGGGGHGTYSHA